MVFRWVRIRFSVIGRVGVPVSLAKQLETHSVEEVPGRLDLTPDGGEFTDIRSSEPITDWTDVFEVVGDTVRMSTWQQSRRTDTGDRDLVNLYSYRAQFRRRTTDAVTEADIEAARENA